MPYYIQTGGGSCSICGAPGVNKVSHYTKDGKVNTDKKHKKVSNGKQSKSTKSKSKKIPAKERQPDPIIINFLDQIEADISTFRGTPINSLFGLIYLLDKYRDSCSTLKLVPGNFEFEDYALVWTCSFDNNECDRILIQPPNFAEIFEKCLSAPGIRHVIIPLSLKYPSDKKGQKKGHANYLIYDKKLGEIERYEPHGATVYEYNNWYDIYMLDLALRNLFEENYNIKYISPLDFCPRKGFQSLEAKEGRQIGDPSGFCAAWSLYWVHLRLENPDISREELMKKGIDHIIKENKDFKRFIRNYSEFIVDRKNEFFKKLPIFDDLYVYKHGRYVLNNKYINLLKDHLNTKIQNFLW